MLNTNNKRMFAKMEGDFVVFMIGMRTNSFHKINKWWPVAMSMPKMLKELYSKKDYGFLSAEAWFGRTTIMLQYWR
jgi:Monooxygenase af470-like